MKNLVFFTMLLAVVFAGCSSAREAVPSSADAPLGRNPGFTGDYQVLRDMDSR
ncbi:MAG TPA: hypothetical protein P5561_06930 [Candidatus Omnitrophota bacterium]|nr:hypothetical protein [Candidatus Omnitrophota bacterium]HRY86236.1 hypothetical protein [Candidatus Omnitrophota bacterium]